jgi:transposase
MISLPTNGNIYLYSRGADLRKSFDGLTGIIRNELGCEPTDGSLFLFLNRRQDRIKILFWDRDGFVLVYKRLERGTFERISCEGASARIDATELAMLLGGVSLKSAKRRRRFDSAA